ncbi:extracellular solute-binding protein [Streptomyces sp. NPDC060194]|uniref:extracellular solute-binding protein n=1 Tax=Streptomyces sp. NPDC060194 TaxID=3347069 RepID=UPI003649CDC5
MTSLDRRTLLRAALGASLATSTLGLAGCGGGGSAGAKQNGSLSVLTPVFATAPGKKVLEGRITKAHRAAYPEARLRVDYNTWDVLPEKISTGLAGGTLADVVMVGFGWIPPFAAKNTFTELDSSLTDKAGYLDQVVAPARYLDKPYARPLGLDPNVVAYRKDHFEAAGITAAPRTLDDLRAAAKELARAKKGGGFERAGIDISSVNLRQLWVNALDAAGGRMFDEEGTKVLFDGAQGVRGLAFMAGLVEDGSTSLSFRSTTPLQSLLKGTSSMMATAASAIGQVAVELGAGNADLQNIGYFVLEDTKPSMFVGGTLVAVNKRSRNQEAAVAFVEEVTAKKNSLAVTDPNGYIPPFADVAADKAVRNPAAPLIRDHLKHSVNEGGSPAWMEIRTVVNPAVEGVLTGKSSVDQALDSLRKQAEDAIGRL